MNASLNPSSLGCPRSSRVPPETSGATALRAASPPSAARGDRLSRDEMRAYAALYPRRTDSQVTGLGA